VLVAEIVLRETACAMRVLTAALVKPEGAVLRIRGPA